MSNGRPVLVRRLPRGEPSEATQMALTGRFLDLEFAPAEAGHQIGDLVEIEDGPVICFGELIQRKGSIATVLIDHSVDRTKLPSLHDAWT
jgi:hypothetical protein